MCYYHKSIVINRCPQYNSDIRPYHLSREIPLYYCHKCGFDLREAKTVRIEIKNQYVDKKGKKITYFEEDDEIRTILYNVGTPYSMEKLNVSPQEYFSIIFTMAIFIIHAYDIEKYSRMFPDTSLINDEQSCKRFLYFDKIFSLFRFIVILLNIFESSLIN